MSPRLAARALPDLQGRPRRAVLWAQRPGRRAGRTPLGWGPLAESSPLPRRSGGRLSGPARASRWCASPPAAAAWGSVEVLALAADGGELGRWQGGESRAGGRARGAPCGALRELPWAAADHGDAALERRRALDHARRQPRLRAVRADFSAAANERTSAPRHVAGDSVEDRRSRVRALRQANRPNRPRGGRAIAANAAARPPRAPGSRSPAGERQARRLCRASSCASSERQAVGATCRATRRPRPTTPSTTDIPLIALHSQPARSNRDPRATLRQISRQVGPLVPPYSAKARRRETRKLRPSLDIDGMCNANPTHRSVRLVV